MDIGSGDLPRGDVNCDLFVGKSPHLDETRGMIDPKKTANFVRCDANYLPFKDKAFTVAMCSHVLEHAGVNPTQALREMIRVARRKVVFRVPHYLDHIFTRRKQCLLHARAFSRSNIIQWLSRLDLPVLGPPEVKVSKYTYFPSENLPLLKRVSEIMVVLRLRRF